MVYGYARVSTGSQSEAAQVAALRKPGTGKVREVAQADQTDRAQLWRLLDKLETGEGRAAGRGARAANGPTTQSNAPAEARGDQAP